MTISPATYHDIPALVNLINSAYRGETSKKGWTTEADLLDGVRTDPASLAGLLNKRDAVILNYLTDKKEIAGCVYLYKQETKLYLGMLTVSADLQAQGIGKQLLAAAEIYARENDCLSIVMNVISIRHELIEWYERHGYQKNGEVKPFPQDTKFGIPKQALEFAVMEKVL